MTRLALKFDGNEVDGRQILTAIEWLTHPIRSVVLNQHYEIVRIIVSNPTGIRWNVAQADRLHSIFVKNKIIGARAYASIMYDSIKSLITNDNYSILREQIFVVPEEVLDYEYLSHETYTKPTEVAFDKEFEYNQSNIGNVIDEFEANRKRVSGYGLPNLDLDDRVKRIVEQTVSSRITSLFLEQSGMSADLSGVSTDLKDISSKFDSMADDISNIKSLTANLENSIIERIKTLMQPKPSSS